MSKYFTILLLAGTLITGTSCSKKDNGSLPQTDIRYMNLNNKLVKYNQHLSVDLDQDGVYDFRIATELTERGLDDVLYHFVSATGANRVLVKNDGEPARKDSGLLISTANEGNFTWDALEPAILVTRVYPAWDIYSNYFEGSWFQQTNKYLPVQLVKEGKRYNGWIRFSFQGSSVDKGIIVHDAAYNKIAEQPIKAGQHQ